MDNINLIRKVAWSFHKSTGLEWDDLFQEAAIAYYEALESYDPSRGKISTYMWWCMISRLKNYRKEQDEYKCRKYDGEINYLEDVTLTKHPAQIASEFWESLSEEATQIANLIFASSKKFVSLPYEQVEERIIHVMTRQGWSIERAQKGIQDLKLACS
jgi:RNA polymerase sigma factor (sigma-70 family)